VTIVRTRPRRVGLDHRLAPASKPNMLLGDFLMKKFVLAIMALVMAAAMPSAQAQHFHVLHEFQDAPKDGASPGGALVRDAAGNLYGTTGFGGAHSAGVVYKIDSSGAESILFSFDGTHGSIPKSSLILDQAGNLYGTAAGGPNGDGVIFRVSASGDEEVLFDFPEKTGIDPVFPTGGLLMDKRGNLFGATTLGGNGNCIDGCGSIYRLNAAGKTHMIHQFTGGADGLNPLGNLVADANGNLYGVAQVGGDLNCSTPEFDDEGCGTVFKLTQNEKFTVLHTFHGRSDGETPQAGLLLNPADGTLYGAAAGGNKVGNGLIFQISKGRYTVLHQFTGTDGSSPNGGMILDEAGNIYGTTQSGGSHGLGTAFVLSPSGQLEVLHNFTGGRDGLGPLTGLTRDSAGNLFGTAFKNLRTKHNEGDVFAITP
jgi:uncharacterized repeat protein (TIGR03803 family)